MDTTFWEILAGTLIFAAGNIAYFEVRRLIRFLKGFPKSKSAQEQ